MPKELISLKSTEGQKLLGESVSQTILLRLFRKQQNRVYCGITSVAQIMSSRELGKKYASGDAQMTFPLSEAKYLEENMFSFSATKSVATEEYVQDKKNGGIVLDEIGQLLTSHGQEVQVHHASASSLEEFRDLALKALSREDSAGGVIVNYDMDVLGQGLPYGHISPVAGYHSATDRFLIMDVWPDTEETWACTEDLFNSMNTVDSVSGKTRGFVIVS